MHLSISTNGYSPLARRAGVILLLCLAPLAFGQTTSTREKTYPDPKRFEKAISAFETKDALTSPPTGAIVCIGSSSMGGWHKTIQQDLAPLTVIPRGFGGSNMNEAVYYADRIVLPYKPRAVVLYEGDNDIASSISAETVRDKFVDFIKVVHGSLPEARIYFLSIKPSPSRWDRWPEMQRANKMIQEVCAANPLLTYIDVATPMLDQAGKPIADIFLKDNLHMNAKGYQIWTAAAKPVLMKGEAQFEKAAPRQ
jgi:lysophospholipase L1-like esterase